MKKLFSVTLALAMAVLVKAQLVEPLSTQRVQLPEGVVSEQATISPDGTFAVVGEMGGGTLTRVDIATGAAKMLTANGLSSTVVISPDGKNVVFNAVTFTEDHLRMNSLHSVNFATGGELELVAPSRHLNAGVAISRTGVIAVENGRARAHSFNSTAAQSLPVASINYGHLEITIDGETTTLDPQGRGSYIWPAVSPDGTKVVYCLCGEGTFVCNIDGSDVRPIGYLNAAKWLTNDLLVGMEDYDDDVNFTQSTIVVADLNGNRQTLTDGSHIAIYPSASANGKRIAYSTLQGELFIINLK